MKKEIKQRDTWFSRVQKAKVIRCHYCGCALHRESVTREHIVPQSSGGSDDASNIVMACKRCNGSRGTSDYASFKAKMLPVKRGRKADKESGDAGG